MHAHYNSWQKIIQNIFKPQKGNEFHPHSNLLSFNFKDGRLIYYASVRLPKGIISLSILRHVDDSEYTNINIFLQKKEEWEKV